jgi:N-methylhydantoinase A/oxoprolinase/acetone carboxylase beta subunit
VASIGVDIGGTFTDVVAVDGQGVLRIAKVPSSRSDPSAPVRTVLADLLPRWGIAAQAVARFVHGTTVATNAVLERKGARLGLLTTAGFEDVLEIGRQNRRQIYQLMLRPETPVFLAPGARRRGVVEGIGPAGEVTTPLDLASLESAVDALLAEGVDAIAVCFLFAFVNPAHEHAVAAWLRERHPSLPVSVSSEVDPAFREYERTVVTAFDAYVKGALDRYLDRMERDLAGARVPARLQLMQSRGGVCSSTIARRRPIRLFLSGPAAGVVGARAVGRSVAQDDVITVDIGGTSSDIALISAGQAMIRPDGLLDGYRIRVPMVDVNSIGAGGGSIAWIDAGGGLRVGPQSAGAEPGPACYGRGGTEATVTDASIVLGYLDPGYFAGGTLSLQPDLAVRAIESRIARPLGMSVRQAALGIHRVVNVQMAEGIRLVSISRGIDPRRFALMPFGGGGALHATALARELGMTRIVVPRYPGVLCAAGLLSAMIEHEASAGFVRPFSATDPHEVLATCAALAGECAARMREEGVADSEVETSLHADVCYVGQAHHIEVALDPSDPARMLERAYDRFCEQHDRVYGHSTRSASRFVNLRVIQRAANRMPAVRPPPRVDAPARKGSRAILLAGATDFVAAEVWERDALAPGDTIRGPAIVEQADTTTLIEPGWTARVAEDAVLLLTEASVR